MESIGATHLWRRCELAPTPAPVEIAPIVEASFDAMRTATNSPTLGVG
jgi:hypothetical protein